MSKVINGYIIPSLDSIKEAIEYIKKRAAEDEAFNQRWQNDPREILTRAGINKPLQNELLLSMGSNLVDEAEFAGCYGCTGCCITTIH